MRCRLAKKGPRFVSIHCGPYLVVSCYVSPNIGMQEYNSFLDELSDALSSRVDRIIIAGDFNAKASLWGSQSTNRRGLLLSKWAAERDLRIANTGHSPTCVRPQGSSIVDLTWVSPELLPLIGNWSVREDLESLSNHLFISFEARLSRPRPPPVRSTLRKWSLRKFDRDFFLAVLTWKGRNPEVEDLEDLSQMRTWLDRTMEEACDAAAPRIGPRRPRRQAYWWRESVALLRHQCIKARRLWQREKRRRGRSSVIIEDLAANCKTKRKELRNEIGRLKSIAWQELIDSIDKDPWGLPYRLVLGKLRPASPSLTELLDPEILSDLLDSLFPRNNLPDPIVDWSNFVWSGEWLVSVPEAIRVIKEVSSSTKAPGPDGFRITVWKRATEDIFAWVTHLFNICLKRDEFPTA